MDPVIEFLYDLTGNDSLKSEISEKVSIVAERLRSGWADSKAIQDIDLQMELKKLLLELARGRISAAGRFSNSCALWLDRFSSMYSTPEIVARYRSSRLKGSSIVDIGSGAGMQSIFFGLSSTVQGIEESERRYLLSLLNLKEFGELPVKFVNGRYPGNSEYITADRNTTVYSDPLRGSGRKSDPQTLEPDPRSIIHSYMERVKGFVFDIPLMMNPDKFGIRGETEYISVDGILARATFYSHPIAEASSSAVLLPSGMRLTGEPRTMTFKDGIAPALVIPDPAIVRANVLYRVAEDRQLCLVHSDSRRLVLASRDHDWDIPGEHFDLISLCSEHSLRSEIARLKPSKVIPRYSVPPETYYRFVNSLVYDTNEPNPLYLIRNGDKIAICRKVTR
ncbi:MAG: hypothetical protein M1267_02055 [Candidatus Thermoplasmatota archaeon]|nr:hypothetical protein [Candidatus Thermoplasmatota archaeon]MCL5800861.1 hypothetical protein [Candidatus Thermoplasmatota archaeon]